MKHREIVKLVESLGGTVERGSRHWLVKLDGRIVATYSVGRKLDARRGHSIKNLRAALRRAQLARDTIGRRNANTTTRTARTT